LLGRIPIRGLHTYIEVDESGYAGLGDIFLLGCALDWLFATEVPLNSFHRLTLSVHPTGMEFQWPPKTGTQQIF
jgi:type VI protein secretion system component VasA